jgi:putative heme-binding domain-containing protein
VHALRLAQSQLNRELEEQIRSMASDPDVTVRFQVALTLGEFGSETANTIARMSALDDSDSWIQTALANSAYRNRGRVIQSLVHHAAQNQDSLQACRPLLLELTGQLARQATEEDLKIVCHVLEEWPLQNEFFKGEFVAQLIQIPNPELQKLQMLLQEAGMSLEQIVERAASQARQMAADPSLASQQRVAAIALLRLGQPATIAQVVSELLELSQPPSVKRAAMELAGNFETAEMGEAILARFQSFNPALRSTALQVLLAREIWTKQLLQQVESGTISPVLVDAATRQRLVRHRNGDIQTRAKNCLGERSNLDRKRLVEQYLVLVNPSTGDVERGRKVFRKSCIACHRLEHEGNEIGPNLAAFANRGTAAMITNILDPNREIDPRFLSFQVQLIDGRTLLGVIANESATTIGLQNSEGNTVTILRQEIEAMQSTTLSLMPENFENEINAEAMADLIRYLLSQGS